MELVVALPVAYEEYVADQGVESVAQVQVLLVCLALEGGFHLTLGVVFGLHLPDVVVGVVQEGILHILSLLAENLFQCPVSDEGLQEQVLLELQSVGLNLLARHS